MFFYFNQLPNDARENYFHIFMDNFETQEYEFRIQTRCLPSSLHRPEQRLLVKQLELKLKLNARLLHSIFNDGRFFLFVKKGFFVLFDVRCSLRMVCTKCFVFVFNEKKFKY